MVFIIKIPTKATAGLAPDAAPSSEQSQLSAPAAPTTPGVLELDTIMPPPQDQSPAPVAADSAAPAVKHEQDDGVVHARSLGTTTNQELDSGPSQAAPEPDSQASVAADAPTQPIAPAHIPADTKLATGTKLKATAPPRSPLDIILSPPVMLHRYVRSHDISMIVERPERIKAVLLGIASAIASIRGTASAGDLVEAMEKMRMQSSETSSAGTPRVLLSERTLALDPPHPAVAYVHNHQDETVEFLESAYARSKMARAASADTPEDLSATPATKLGEGAHSHYLHQLCRDAPGQMPPKRIKRFRANKTAEEDDSGDERPSEVPSNLNQGDLYLCGPSDEFEHTGAAATDEVDRGGSGEAIPKALGACAEAVDRVYHAAHSSSPPPAALDAADASDLALPATRAFLLTRPPGHHCTGNAPQGFCWVNNAMVAAAHAHLTHGVDRVAIFDIDLHHGNGTQALAWRINADSARLDAEQAARLAHAQKPRARKSGDLSSNLPVGEERRGLKIFYGSLHDIESYPCEAGDQEMIHAASTCIEGAHGQWIWNVHLQNYQTEAGFDALYTHRYSTLFAKARAFFAATGAEPSTSLILISAGFDACEHEYQSMQRHGKHVPPSFYHRFATDTIQLASEVCSGKVISLLEGGYSDRALTSAAMAHILGLASTPCDRTLWHMDQLVALERAAKKAAVAKTLSARRKVADPGRSWVSNSVGLWKTLTDKLPRVPKREEDDVADLSTHSLPARTLRARNKPPSATTATSTPVAKRVAAVIPPASAPARPAWRNAGDESLEEFHSPSTVGRKPPLSTALDLLDDDGPYTPTQKTRALADESDALTRQLESMGLQSTMN